jgi:hypothetical protein
MVWPVRWIGHAGTGPPGRKSPSACRRAATRRSRRAPQNSARGCARLYKQIVADMDGKPEE